MHDNYQYDIVKRMSFIRYGGTAEEKKAADILMGEIEKLGGKGEYQEFTIPAAKLNKYSVKITAPYEKEIESMPFGCSGSFPEGGADLKLYYAQGGKPENYLGIDDLSGYAVLLDEFSYDAYKLLCKKNASAFLLITNSHWDNDNSNDLVYRPLRTTFTVNGVIPGFQIWASDATDMVRDGVTDIHLELEQDEYEATSRNVLATIEGTDIKDESIVITAHYDSVMVGTGAWDNATGSATIMYIYRHFLNNRPRRTLRFVWCGSEEQGLLGSKAYVEQCADIVGSEIKFCFNFDMCGTVLGSNSVFVTGGDDLKHYAEAFCREYGMIANFREGVHSSDSAPFCDKGIPALGLSRGSRTCAIHTRNDVIFPLSADQLKKDGDFAVAFISRVASCAILPVPTGMPAAVKEKIDAYFLRNKTTLKQDEEKSAK
ncbi:MAG: Zn-dependent exopeptidase M28 [Clostridia bacterium]|nr:Zn-dependent exopeptidase M28 [Clostridia bacterium]